MKRSYIVVLTNRWVLAGYIEDEKENELVLSKPVCIRRWGTTQGLGELARGGPTKETILDPYGDRVRLNREHVMHIIECREKVQFVAPDPK